MDFKNLIVYKKSFDVVMKILEITKNFPEEEKYALIDQIGRSSKGVTATISELYRKQKHPKHFISKFTDSDFENAETQTWLEFSLTYKYTDQKTLDYLTSLSLEVDNLINYTINNPRKFGAKGTD
ncbi:four helix bundle protein [Aquimarina sp. M1]